MQDLLVGLTSNQKEAVTHIDGPVLVVAGAGTGKTNVITRRIAWLINEGHAKPEEILALTFTDKAAAEMLSRVDEVSDFVYSDLSISTFHSFGSDIITEYAFELGLPADFKVLTDVEQILFIKDHIFDFTFKHFKNLSDPTSLIKELVKTFSRAKDELVTEKSWTSYLEEKLKGTNTQEEREEAEKELEIAKAFGVYNNLLRSEGYIDYGDQIALVLKLLEKPSIASKLKKRFKFALVDEFQDTNFAQNELVRKLFGEDGNVMVVGDDDQSIYKFRGAAVENILEFKNQYKKVKTIVLSENFRSTQEILDKSYGFIQNNNPQRLESKYKINKKLKSHIGKGEEPKLMLFETESQEAEGVSEEIVKRYKNGEKFSEMALLLRTNNQAEEFLRTFKKHGIPYVFSGAAGLYEKHEVKMLVSLICALSDPEDDLALFHLAASEAYDVSGNDLVALSRWAKERNRPLSKVFANAQPLAEQLELSKKSVETFKKIIEDLNLLREEAKTASAGEVVNLFLRTSGYYTKLTKEAQEGSLEANNRISNVAAFFDKIIHFQRNYKDHSMESFYRYLKLVLDAGDDPKPFEPTEGLEAVNILTIHKAKGLEFETVFVSSLSDSHFPARNRSGGLPFFKDQKGETNLFEERRLFYVAATRAKKNLYLTAAQDYGTKKTHKISRFVTEMMGEKNIETRFLKTEPIEKIKHFEKVNSYYGIKLEEIPSSEKITLSRAAIDDWLTCPFKYQLIHITPIRLIADANVAFGNAIHNTIGEYYKRKMAGKKVRLSEIFDWYDLFWNESGFLSKRHEDERYASGKKGLEDFYNKQEQGALPSAVEKEFKFRIENNFIKGRYDAIFYTKEGVEVIDFKTSNIKTKKEADERTKKSTQLATYALSWKILNGELPKKVKLYFIESGLVGEYEPTEKDALKTEEEILKATEGIRKRDFHPAPSQMICGYCPFKFYCSSSIVKKVV